jgi:broad specificity phosphatase PhoE
VTHHPFDDLAGAADFYIVRHGQSEGNRSRLVQGHTDLPLTDQGRAQARATGAWFRGRKLDLILSSPLGRAHETARLIASEAGLDPGAIILTDKLKELDTGIFSNMTFTDIESVHNEAYRIFRARSWEGVPGAETIQALMHRAVDHWGDLVGFANGGSPAILSVTHGGFFQWLFRSSFNAQWQTWMPLVDQANCAINQISVESVDDAPASEAHRYFAEWRSINRVVW